MVQLVLIHALICVSGFANVNKAYIKCGSLVEARFKWVKSAQKTALHKLAQFSAQYFALILPAGIQLEDIFPFTKLSAKISASEMIDILK